MKYCYEVIKKDGVSEKMFESAFYCSETSVESILYDHDVIVSTVLPFIFVSQKTKNKIMPFSLAQCGELIKGAFIDAGKKTYMEFEMIKPTEVNCV